MWSTGVPTLFVPSLARHLPTKWTTCSVHLLGHGPWAMRWAMGHGTWDGRVVYKVPHRARYLRPKVARTALFSLSHGHVELDIWMASPGCGLSDLVLVWSGPLSVFLLCRPCLPETRNLTLSRVLPCVAPFETLANNLVDIAAFLSRRQNGPGHGPLTLCKPSGQVQLWCTTAAAAPTPHLFVFC